MESSGLQAGAPALPPVSCAASHPAVSRPSVSSSVNWAQQSFLASGSVGVEWDEGDSCRPGLAGWAPERVGVAEGSASLGVAPGVSGTPVSVPSSTPWTSGAQGRRHIPFSSARHTVSIAVPHVCVWRFRGDLCSLRGGLPSLPGLIKQKLATACATLPTAWAHSPPSSCHCHGYFYSSLWEPRIKRKR